MGNLTILCNNIGVVAGDGSTVSNFQVVRNSMLASAQPGVRVSRTTTSVRI